MIQLYCLQCNRPNDAESRFCGGCGAGLVRKFCSRCHAINAADSHFCQACGAQLPSPPSVSAPPSYDLIPNLTDTVEMPLAPVVAPTATAPLWASPAGPMTAVHWPVAATMLPPAQPPAAPSRKLRGLLSPGQLILGVLGAGVVLALAAAVSPRTEVPEPDRSAADILRLVPTTGARQRTEPVSETGAVVPMRDTRTTTAGHAEAAVHKPLVDRPVATGEGVDAALAQAQKALGATAAVSRTAAVAAATAAPAAVVRARPIKPAASAMPAARTPDCTPEVHALGLCAPGARIIGRP